MIRNNTVRAAAAAVEEDDRVSLCAIDASSPVLGRDFVYVINGAGTWCYEQDHMKTVATGLYPLQMMNQKAPTVRWYQERLRVGLGIIHSKLSEATLLADCRELDENFERSGTLPFRLMLLATLDHQGLLALIQFDSVGCLSTRHTTYGTPPRVLYGQFMQT